MSDAQKKYMHHFMEELLSYHVEYDTLTPMILRRVMHIFFEQFDPNRMYLLHSEVTPFLRADDTTVREILMQHQHSQYTVYETVEALMRTGVMRCKNIRQELGQEWIQSGSMIQIGEKREAGFPKNIADLRRYIQHVFHMAIVSVMQEEYIQEPTRRQREQIVSLVEKRFSIHEDSYCEEKNAKTLSEHVMKAFARSLDAHTNVFTEDEALQMRLSLEKNFEGLGVVLREGIEGVCIRELVPGGPAEKSGAVQVGDKLLAIDGKRIIGISYKEVMGLLRKNRKGQITLVLWRDDQGEFTVSLRKEKIVLHEERVSYEVTPFGDGIIGIISLPSFYENGDGMSVEKDMKNAIQALKRKGNLLGLIVDVRENTGGFLNQAVKVASLFMTSGVVVVSKYAHNQEQCLRDVNGQMFYEGPLVFLTSKLSASATEIVAQALQDYGIALIVGDHRTYGKGTIQYQNVTDGKADKIFKVTIGKYYTVSGRSTQMEGVKADIIVPTHYAPFHIGEKYLLYPLKNDKVASRFFESGLDVHEKNLYWLKEHSLPNLQKRLSQWQDMLPVLKKNSEYRLQHSRDFAGFFALLQSHPTFAQLQAYEASIDLQLQEALHVVQDMILLR